jgi:hypothetical protein
MKKALSALLSTMALFAMSFAQTKDSASAAVDPAQPAAATASTEEKLSDLKGQVDGINESYLGTKATVDKLAKIKISGYTQFQIRTATNFKDATDTTINKAKPGTYLYPVGDFSGGKFSQGVGSVEQLRRARLKVAYETELTTAVLQLDCIPFTYSNAATAVTSATTYDTATKKYTTTNTPSNAAYLNGGGVTIKDAYLRFTEPWLKSFSLMGGVFDRPFGFEIHYSSSNRETPERSRTEQTLFPGERDLGLALEMYPGENMGFMQYINFKGGVFTGNGINVETDNARDFMGRLGFSVPLKEIGLGIDGGASGYFGKVTSWNDVADSFSVDTKTFIKGTKNYDKTFDRKYYGGDLQLYYSLPVIGGLSLRGEVYTGKQPGFATSTSSPSNNILNTNPVFIRNFLGFYAWYVQNIDPIRSQLVVKFDSYDPNTDIKVSDINGFDSTKLATSGVSFADLMFNTIGLGWIYHWDENIKLMLYYDIVQPEKVKNVWAAKTSSSFYPYTLDMKANVLTFRVQYKF